MGCGGSKQQPLPPTPPAAKASPQSQQPPQQQQQPAGQSPNAEVGVPLSPTMQNDPPGVYGGASSSANRQMAGDGMLRRQRTLLSDRYELDVVVSQFIAHDSTIGSAIGRGCKETQWKVMYDLDAAPIAIKVNVQERKVHYNEVGIEVNGQAMFHGAGAKATTRMMEDFDYQWPFRGSVRGLNEASFFELRPNEMMPDQWYPCTITQQRQDGFFEVSAYQFDGRLHREVKYPAVHRNNLREAVSQRPLPLPETSLMLHVPKADPVNAYLSLGGQSLTHVFGRPSPPPLKKGQEKQKIQFQVNKDRSAVTANVGHSVLAHWCSGEVRSVTSAPERLSHSWTLQIGPFARHTIKVSKNYTLGKIITLTVDDEIFVEASAADIGCKADGWRCDFRFVGEKTIDFEVFKTNSDGSPLQQTAHVPERRKYTHQCSVLIDNKNNFSQAQFVIDGNDFRQLPLNPILHQESGLSMDPRVLMQTYGIAAPYRVDPSAPNDFSNMANTALASITAAPGFFGSCCNAGSVVADTSENAAVVPQQKAPQTL